MRLFATQCRSKRRMLPFRGLENKKNRMPGDIRFNIFFPPEGFYALTKFETIYLRHKVHKQVVNL